MYAAVLQVRRRGAVLHHADDVFDVGDFGCSSLVLDQFHSSSSHIKARELDMVAKRERSKGFFSLPAYVKYATRIPTYGRDFHCSELDPVRRDHHCRLLLSIANSFGSFGRTLVRDRP